MKKFMCLLLALLMFLTLQTIKSEAKILSRQEAFRKAARAFIEKHIFPDGERIDKDELYDNFSENEIALCDVDNDGKMELLIRFQSGSMASKREFVCGYNDKTGKLFMKLTCFPATEYFTNGCVREYDSHNQGLGGEFWPYSFSVYDSKTGRYEYKGSVDAWSKEYSPTNIFENDEPFPDKIDVAGDGFLYYIDDKNFDKVKDNSSPVDTPVYNEWEKFYIGDAKVIEINWLPANKKGLKALDKALNDIDI